MPGKAPPLRAIQDLAEQMEAPLDTAIGLARGLDLIAQEIEAQEDRTPVLALAALLADRLALVKQTWRAIKDASGRV
jgi:hypothetical protein